MLKTSIFSLGNSALPDLLFYLMYKLNYSRNYDYSNTTVWDLHKYGKYIDIGLYPNSINLFKHYSKELKAIFNHLPENKESAYRR